MTQEKGPIPGIRKLARVEAMVRASESQLQLPGMSEQSKDRSSIVEVGWLGLPGRKVKLDWSKVDAAAPLFPKINIAQTTRPYGE